MEVLQISDEQNLLTHLRSINNLLQTPEFRDGSTGIVVRRISSHLRRGDSLRFQMQTLGVYGGAFGLANNQEQHFMLLENAKFPPRPDMQVINIPHISPGKTKAFGEMIDYMFIQRRGQQKLRPDTEGEQVFAPEFYWHLAPCGSRRSVRAHPVALRQGETFRNLYCSSGEVSFGLYAWRLLLRWAQCNDQDINSIFEPGKISFMRTMRPRRALWPLLQDQERWSALPEATWLSAIAQLNDDLAGPANLSESKLKFMQQVISQWSAWSASLDDNTSPDSQNPWLSDWASLGLLDQPPEHQSKDGERHKIGVAMIPLLRYAMHVASVIEEEPCAGYDSLGETYRRTAGRCQLRIQEIIGSASDVMGINELEEVDKCLQWLIEAFFRHRCAGSEDCTVGFCLRTLHECTRFPIIPFFYVTAVDRKPKAHLVFPVWESSEFPVSIYVPRFVDVGKSKVKESGDTYWEIESPVVGVALLMVKPIPEVDWTLMGDNVLESARDGDFGIGRMDWITTYWRPIARPLCDINLYGQMVRQHVELEARASQQVETLAMQYAAEAHEVRKLIRLIGMKKNPEFVFKEIRNYLNSQFGGVFLPEDQRDSLELPPELGVGTTLHDFVLNAAKIATRIHTIVRWSRSSQLISKTKKELESESSRLVSKLKLSRKLKSTPFARGALSDGQDYLHRQAFCLALVSALQNTYKHADLDRHICVTKHTESGYLCVSIMNYAKSEILDGELVVESVHPGSTKQVIEYFVSLYGLGSDGQGTHEMSGRFDEYMRPIGKDDRGYLTSIPCPPNVAGYSR